MRRLRRRPSAVAPGTEGFGSASRSDEDLTEPWRRLKEGGTEEQGEEALDPKEEKENRKHSIASQTLPLTLLPIFINHPDLGLKTWCYSATTPTVSSGTVGAEVEPRVQDGVDLNIQSSVLVFIHSGPSHSHNSLNLFPKSNSSTPPLPPPYLLTAQIRKKQSSQFHVDLGEDSGQWFKVEDIVDGSVSGVVSRGVGGVGKHDAEEDVLDPTGRRKM